MVQINFGQREVNCKVVYYGPAMAGKTTNIEWIHQHSPQAHVGDLVSITTTETDRTLYFDFLPLDLGLVSGMRTKFKLYTVPGQVYYNATRKLVLQGSDGVIFVADSRPERMNDNVEALMNLRMNLDELGLPIERLPLVLQYNLRDLPNAMTVRDMDARLNPKGFLPVYSGIARDGTGVFACLMEVSRSVIDKLNQHPLEDGGIRPDRGTVDAKPQDRAQRNPARNFTGATGSGTAGALASARPSPAAATATLAAPPAAAVPDHVSSSTSMPVMRSASPPAMRRPPTPPPAPAHPPADLPASTEGAPILTIVTILAAIIVLICIVAGAYALFPVNGTALH